MMESKINGLRGGIKDIRGSLWSGQAGRASGPVLANGTSTLP